jgi:Fic family protein
LERLIKKAKFVLEKRKDILDYQKFNHYAIVHHSNAIEGSMLDINETNLLLDENIISEKREKLHSLMALDHLKALKFILNKADNKSSLDVNSLQKTSSLILKNTGGVISCMGGEYDSSKGEFRKQTVYAGSTMFVNYLKVPGLVKTLINELNETLNQCNTFEEIQNLAFDAHYQLVSIHPFADGNGRLSRLLMNYVQQYHNQPLSFIFKEDKAEYFKALQTSRKEETTLPFREFMYKQYNKQLTKEVDLLLEEPIYKKRNKGFGLSFLF